MNPVKKELTAYGLQLTVKKTGIKIVYCLLSTVYFLTKGQKP